MRDASDNAIALSVNGLTKRFGGLVAVDNISFDLPAAAPQRHHRPERRRQDHAVQSDHRRDPPDAGRVVVQRPRHHRAEAAPDRAQRHLAHAADQERVSAALGRRQRAHRGHDPRGIMSPFRSGRILRRASTARVDELIDEVGLTPASATRSPPRCPTATSRCSRSRWRSPPSRKLLLLDEPVCGMGPQETERTVAKIKEIAKTHRHRPDRARHGGGVRYRRRHHGDGARRDPRPRHAGRDRRRPEVQEAYLGSPEERHDAC